MLSVCLSSRHDKVYSKVPNKTSCGVKISQIHADHYGYRLFIFKTRRMNPWLRNKQILSILSIYNDPHSPGSVCANALNNDAKKCPWQLKTCPLESGLSHHIGAWGGELNRVKEHHVEELKTRILITLHIFHRVRKANEQLNIV